MANRTNLNGHRLRLPSTRTAFYLPPLVLVVALILLAVVLAVPATAQDSAGTPGTVIWSATLTVDEDAGGFGCDNIRDTQTDCSSALTDDDFEYNGLTYQVLNLNHYASNDLVYLSLNPSPLGRLAGLVLHLDSTQVTFSTESHSISAIRWRGVNPQWSDGQQVAVKLVVPPIAPTDDSCPKGRLSVSSTSATRDSITVNWETQRLANDAKITGYQVFWRVAERVRHQKGTQLGPDARTWTIPGLSQDTRYYVWLTYQTGGQWLDCGTKYGPVRTEPPPTPTPAPTPTPTPPPLKVFPVQFEANHYHLNEPEGKTTYVKFRCNPKLSDEQCASAHVQIYIASSAADIAAGDAKHGAMQQATFDIDYEFRSNWSGAPPRAAEWDDAPSVRVAVANDQEDEPSERFYIVAQYTPDLKKYVAVDIQDSGSTFMDFYIREVVAKEEERSVWLRVLCTTAVCEERDHSFTIETSNKVRKEAAKVKGSDLPHATVGTDYEKTTFTRTVSKGSDYTDVTIAIMDDHDSEPDELMFVKMTVNGVENQEPRYAFITIKDADTAAVIGFNPTQYTRTEGIHPHVDLTVSREGGPVSLPVQFTVTVTDESTTQYNEYLAESGTTPVASLASQDIDYKAGKYKGRLGPGETSTTVRIPLIDDNIAEATDRFVAHLSVDSSGGEADDSTEWALVSLRDNEELLLQSLPRYCQLAEQGKKKGDQCKLGISLGGPIHDSVSFSVTSSDTSAATVNKSELTFTKDNWNKPQKVTVKAIDDHDYESELVKITVQATFTSGIQTEAKNILEVPILVLDNDTKYLKPNEYMFVPTISAHGSDPKIKLVLGAPATERIDYKAKIRGHSVPSWTNGILVGQTGAEFTFQWFEPPTPPSNPSPYQLIIYEVVITEGLDGYTQVGPSSYYLIVMPPTGGL